MKTITVEQVRKNFLIGISTRLKELDGATEYLGRKNREELNETIEEERNILRNLTEDEGKMVMEVVGKKKFYNDCWYQDVFIDAKNEKFELIRVNNYQLDIIREEVTNELLEQEEKEKQIKQPSRKTKTKHTQENKVLKLRNVCPMCKNGRCYVDFNKYWESYPLLYWKNVSKDKEKKTFNKTCKRQVEEKLKKQKK